MRSWLATALLALVCLFSLPCLYFAVFVFGIVPVSVMTGLTVQWLSASDGMVLGLISLLNAVIAGALVFAASRWVVRRIYARLAAAADLVVGAVIVAAAVIGLLPIFFLAAHDAPDFQSAYALLFELLASRA
jgi:hypothetical protein